MGKTLTLIGMMLFINIVGMIVALGVGSVDPNTDMLLSNALFGPNNMISPSIQNYNSGNPNDWSFQNNMSAYLPTGSATEAGSSGTSYPDWINSSLKWISQIFSVLLNIVGAPYSFLSWMFGTGGIASIIGVGLSIINLFILVNWIFGKVD